jgi:DNA-binding transcriptional MocR family regulator
MASQFFQWISLRLDGIGSVFLNTEAGVEYSLPTQIAEVTTGHMDRALKSVSKYKPENGMVVIPMMQETFQIKNLIPKIIEKQNKLLPISGVFSGSDGSQLRFSGSLTENIKINTSSKDAKVTIQGDVKLV